MAANDGGAASFDGVAFEEAGHAALPLGYAAPAVSAGLKVTHRAGMGRSRCRPHADGLAARILATCATQTLHRRYPQLSAKSPLPGWQRAAPIALLAGGVTISALTPSTAHQVLAALLALPFLLIVMVRVVAVWHLLSGREGRRKDTKLSPAMQPADLPTYTLLVPLYNEAAVVGALVRALAALDYPAHLLEILFLTEEDDAATRMALTAAHPLGHMQIVTVPAGLPRTKPRALNYGLQLARGSLIAVFDAEDCPDILQLRIAAEAFAGGDTRLACVQARLTAHNAADSFWSRQFAIEYVALFDAILPALDRLGLPIPLGGTSNHFRRDVLVAAGGWDAYNVTEDADLGFRLARLGYRVATIDSGTWEEAPVHWRVWLGQRTRWLKGWTLTYLVHMRDPAKLYRDLGLSGFLGLQMTLGGMILSSIVHPPALALLLWSLLTADPYAAIGSGGLVAVCLFNLFIGYAAGMTLAVLAVRRRGQGHLAASAALIPVYWLAISYAAYKAMFDLVRRPYYWEKTPHGFASETLKPFRT